MALVPLAGPAREPVSLAEAKAYLRVTGTSEDLLIASLITAARVHLEVVLSCAFIRQTWSWFLDDWPRRLRLDLPLGPVTGITALADPILAKLKPGDLLFWSGTYGVNGTFSGAASVTLP